MVEFFFVETIRMSTQTKEWVDILKKTWIYYFHIL